MIKRYERDQIEDIAIFSESKNGFYVKYNDHLAAIKQAKIDAVREFVKWVCKQNATIEFEGIEDDLDEYEQLKEQQND